MPSRWAGSATRWGSRSTSSSISRVCSRAASVVGLLLERGGRERRLLHRGVEQQQPDDAAEQHQATSATNGTRGGPAYGAAGTTREPGPLDRGLGDPRDPRPDLDEPDCSWLLPPGSRLVRSRAAGPRRRAGSRRSRRRSAFSAPRVTRRSAGSWPSGHERQVLRHVAAGRGGERLLDQPVLQRVVGLHDHAAADADRVDRGRAAPGAAPRARR